MTAERDSAAHRRLDPAGEGAARHGIAAPRGQSAAGARGGRFTRLFGFLPPCDAGEAANEALALQMKDVQGTSARNAMVPAGYTYLGQFIDHDITFDPTSNLQRDNDPHALVNFRTPSVDLDSVYGSGPADQPFLYDWNSSHPGVRLLIGANPCDARCLAAVDLPRNAHGRALIPEARNDENLIVSQLHLLFMQFHNKVVDCLCERGDTLTSNELFDEAQRIVRWHYQWIVATDFLPKIVGDDMATCVHPGLVERPGITAPAVERRIYRWRDRPAIPVEFSAAAYRFGHSMVRRDYSPNAKNLKARILPGPGPGPVDGQPPEHLGGFRWLPAAVKIEWQRFFGHSPPAQASMQIDHALAAPLFTLPPDDASLASLNLRRGHALGLPSGSDVARALGQRPLDEDELFPKRVDPFLSDFWPAATAVAERKAVLRSPPLWFYLLREAHSRNPDEQGEHLGPIGGRIVAEVMMGLLEGDPESYLRRDPLWTPEREAKILGFDAAHPGKFTMADLVAFTVPQAPDTPDS